VEFRNEITKSQITAFRRTILELADEARETIRSFAHKNLLVDTKSDGSLVTQVDLAIEERLREIILIRYPDHGIMGEELPPIAPGAEFQWILDPIDGTEEFIRGLPFFGTIIALHFRGAPIVSVIDHRAFDLRCSAGFRLGTFCNDNKVTLASYRFKSPSPRGGENIIIPALADFVKYRDDADKFYRITRSFTNHRIFRTCYGHTCAVTGMCDAGLEYDVGPWDLAATRLLIEETGGKFSVFRQERIPQVGVVSGAAFGNPTVVQEILSALC
jgi:fructose-1,6-bisphosphatase/inositol monophosphatase family enzyme